MYVYTIIQYNHFKYFSMSTKFYFERTIKIFCEVFKRFIKFLLLEYYIR